MCLYVFTFVMYIYARACLYIFIFYILQVLLGVRNVMVSSKKSYVFQNLRTKDYPQRNFVVEMCL